jgi:hypothetical protein
MRRISGNGSVGRFIPSQHPRTPKGNRGGGRFVRVLGSSRGTMVRVVNPGRPSRIPYHLTSGRPGTGHGRRARKVSARRTATSAARHGRVSTGRVSSGRGGTWTRRGPKG